jgi:hypothetical protein
MASGVPVGQSRPARTPLLDTRQNGCEPLLPSRRGDRPDDRLALGDRCRRKVRPRCWRQTRTPSVVRDRIPNSSPTRRHPSTSTTSPRSPPGALIRRTRSGRGTPTAWKSRTTCRWALACSSSFPPGQMPVERHGQLLVSRPLRSTTTPASSGFPATTSRSASERRVGTQCLRCNNLGTLPLATLGTCDPDRRIDARLLTFRARAADQAHAASTPAPPGQEHGHPPSSSLGAN